MRRRRPLLAVATVLCVATLAATAPAGASPPPGKGNNGSVTSSPTAPAASPPPAVPYVTTADGTLRLAQGAAVPAGSAHKGRTTTLSVARGVTDQVVAGTGAALTHSSAHLLAGLPTERRAQLLRELFDPTGPVRLSVLRIPLGGTDFVVGAPYTYLDLPAGQEDWDLAGMSTARDEEALRPVLREILAIAPDLTIIASPWSPPAWMKDSGALGGGQLRDDPRAVPAYAEYLTRALREHRDAGVVVDLLTVQNEPQTRWSADYPRMYMPAAVQVAVVEELGPRLAAAGLPTRVLAFDHNWAQHPWDLAALRPGEDPEHDYALRVLGSPAAPWLAGVAYHCYAGDASAQDVVRQRHPAAEVWVTECSGSHGPQDGPAKVFADTLMWQGRHLLVGSLRHGATGVLTWNLALDASGGPRSGGCETCTGVVTVQGGGVTANAEYHVLAHASRFAPPGSVRVSSGGTTPVRHVALRAPDGGLAVVALNEQQRVEQVVLDVDGTRYAVTFPARSLTTVVVPAAP